MKQKSNHLLLKALTISFFIHVTGISLFSIVFPLPSPKRPPIEVTLIPSAADKKIHLGKTEIIPELPVIKSSLENITKNIPESLKIATKKFTGSFDTAVLTKITTEFKLPEFKIKFPSLPEIKNQSGTKKEKSYEKIEGPAGERKLIYREKIQYPAWAEEKGMEGNVKIKFWVEPDGRISDVELLTSSGYPELDIYTISKFRKYLFQPVDTNRKVWGMITFVYRLK